MPITQILLTSNSTTTPPVTPQGQYIYNNGFGAWGAVGVYPDGPTYFPAYQLPDTTTEPVWEFDGVDQYMYTSTVPSPTLTAITIEFYFKPLSSGKQLMGLQDSYTENSGYHAVALEINSNNTVNAGLWNGLSITSVTSSGTISPNAWNHIYLCHTGTQMRFQLNGGTLHTSNFTWAAPTPLALAFGTIDTATSMNPSNNARYQGAIANLVYWPSVQANNIEASRSRYGV